MDPIHSLDHASTVQRAGQVAHHPSSHSLGVLAVCWAIDAQIVADHRQVVLWRPCQVGTEVHDEVDELGVAVQGTASDHGIHHDLGQFVFLAPQWEVDQRANGAAPTFVQITQSPRGLSPPRYHDATGIGSRHFVGGDVVNPQIETEVVEVCGRTKLGLAGGFVHCFLASSKIEN